MKLKQKKKFTGKAAVIILIDCLMILLAGGLAIMTRFEYSFAAVPDMLYSIWFKAFAIQIVITVVIFWLRNMYHQIWRSVNIYDVVDMVISIFLAYGMSCLAWLLFQISLPRSVLVMELLFLLVLQVAMRCAMRLSVMLSRKVSNGKDGERLLVIGGGEAGRALIHEIQMGNKLVGRVCGIIDDNPQKWGMYLNGVPILGGREKISEVVAHERITQIVFAIPTATAEQKREILNICKMTRCKVRILPGAYQLINGEVSLAIVKDVQVEDLLGRDTIRLNGDSVGPFLRDKVVLVTGGGGSIGSELCRQIAYHRPRTLVILDCYENSAYQIQQELLHLYGDKLNLKVEIASVRDKARMYQLFDHHRPDIVFHAAAHKHVPLMEDCPSEAVKNNVFGTYHVVRASEKYGVKKFVMISTDKAVNPTNFMGATKRFCEMILQSRSGSDTEFCSVRFGNVLGSNGSVVPLFKKQIEEGGPVTLTDKRVIRYFMTIPEAVQLVLEAGAMARQHQVFVLDMGEPVKILDLAENLIRLSGLEPYKDIEIKEVGLRPGEKLYEELLIQSEDLLKTSNSKIFVEQQSEITQEEIMQALETLDQAVTEQIDNAELLALMKRLVPTYREPTEVNAAVSES